MTQNPTYLLQFNLLLVKLNTFKHLAHVCAFDESFQCDFFILINLEVLLLFSNEWLLLIDPFSNQSFSPRTLYKWSTNDVRLSATPLGPVNDGVLIMLPDLSENDFFLVNEENKSRPSFAAIDI